MMTGAIKIWKNICLFIRLGLCFDEFTAAGDTFLNYYGGQCDLKHFPTLIAVVFRL